MQEDGVQVSDGHAFAARSQARWAVAHEAGIFADEIVPVVIPQRKGDPIVVDTDEHPRPGTTPALSARKSTAPGQSRKV